MKKTRYLITAVAVLAISACSGLVEPDTPYRKALVVRSVLTDGHPIVVEVSRTLPLDRPIDPEGAYLDDAVVLVEHSRGVDTLIPGSGEPGHYSAQDLVAEAGETYRLQVEWDGLRVSGSTRVPRAAEIDSLAVEVPQVNPKEGTKSVRLKLAVRTHDGAVVAPTARPLDWTEDFTSALWAVLGPAHADSSGLIHFSTEQEIPNQIDRAEIIVYSYDQAFLPFYETWYLNGRGGPFGSTVDAVEWNVTGDGVGLFIGRSGTRREVDILD